jgi:FkbM family methyltransferase
MSESLGHKLKALLLPLSLRIRQGPLKGLKWVAVSGSKFVKGTYEPGQSAVFSGCVHPGDVVFDVGAHVGYYTALASLLAGPAGRVIAFEPRPLNLRFLRRHVELNRLDNVSVIAAGVGKAPGLAHFETRTGTGTGHLSDAGDLEVKLVSLDDLVRRRELPPPKLIKIDVEGAEMQVLDGAEEVIRTTRPNLLISTHGAEIHHAVLKRLEAWGYVAEGLNGRSRETASELLARPKG